MRLLLIQPPVEDFYDTDIRLQPLGLCMLKAAVKKHLPQVEVLVKDYHQGHGRNTIPYPDELNYLKPYYLHPDQSPFSMFHQYYHFGAAFEEIGKDVAALRPDIVGISSLFSPYYREALSCAREIKKDIDVPVIMGGSHVSASPLTMLKDPNVDYIIRGEGERPLVEFLRALQSNAPLQEVPNLGFKQNGEPVLNPMGEPYDLNDIPLADLSDLPTERYLFEKRPICFLTTSRGCPHRCSFCSVHLTFGEKFRGRPLGNILTEIRKRYDEGYRVFDFEDDNLTFNRENFKSLLSQLIVEFPKGDLRLVAMNGISYLSLDTELLGLMKKAGFTHLNISLVTANSKSLLKVNRPHTIEKYMEVVKHAHALGLKIVSYQIVGLPYETLEDMISTMSIMAALPVLIGVSIFYLTPGCPMANEFPPMTESDIFKSRSTAMAIETGNFHRDDIYSLFITARIINFIKGIITEKDRFTFREALDAASLRGTRDKIGAEILRCIFKEKVLYAAAKNGLKPLPRFKADLFLKVWGRLAFITTQDGAVVISVD
ncbi:Radical SAM domain protein [uncultured Desulfobacterium sp.]|uniref:Radical SAM domain protein n=1 Tax=uncultured Desulfobacterium sp. TaxID=201089 RepID=A0A445MX80_9BACT|nr:Radical SAM domain protein [uncultured Desulfobacterium sp.]